MQQYITITPVSPRGTAVSFNLLGDSAMGRTGGGGWQITDRPRRAASTEWLDYSPFELTLPLLLGGGLPQRSVETDCGLVESWEKPAPGSITPPVLMFRGPAPHPDLRWVVKSLSFGEALRNLASGARVQQTLNMTLLEFVPPIISLSNVSPARAAQGRQRTAAAGAGASRRYVVKSGDTLSGIAARVLGDYKRYRDIATLNNIRDPSSIRVGQSLALPAR